MGDRLEIPELARRARWRRIGTVLAILALAAGGTAVLMPEQVAGELYRTGPVSRRNVVKVVEASGHLDVRSRVEVPPPVPGRLVEILATVRTVVHRGQPLARLDTRAAALAVREAQASVQAASGRVAEARATRDAAAEDRQRVERLRARGRASDQDLSNARSAEERARAALQAARALQVAASGSVATAELGQNLGEIVAPADGVVLTAPERLGAAVSPERGALFILGESLDVLRIDATVGEADIGDVRVGQSTEFDVQAFPGRVFRASVERIGLEPVIEAGLVMYPVTLLAENPDFVLLPGMTASVRMQVARRDGVMSVREAALRFTPDDASPAHPRSRVWRRITGGRLEPVPVTVGLSDGAYTEVTAGPGASLREGDLIAIGLMRPELGASRPGISLSAKKR